MAIRKKVAVSPQGIINLPAKITTTNIIIVPNVGTYLDTRQQQRERNLIESKKVENAPRLELNANSLYTRRRCLHLQIPVKKY